MYHTQRYVSRSKNVIRAQHNNRTHTRDPLMNYCVCCTGSLLHQPKDVCCSGSPEHVPNAVSLLSCAIRSINDDSLGY